MIRNLPCSGQPSHLSYMPPFRAFNFIGFTLFHHLKSVFRKYSTRTVSWRDFIENQTDHKAHSDYVSRTFGVHKRIAILRFGYRSMLQSISIVAVLAVSGCCTSPDKSGPPPPEQPRCSANGRPNSEAVIGTSCKFVVQTKEVCVYDEEGRLKEITSKADGACFCIGGGF